MTKDARRYYRKIKTLVPSKDKYKESLLKGIKMRILELENLSDNVTFEDLCDIIGTPEDVITNYYNTIDIDYLLKRLRITRTIRICAYIALVVIILCSAIFIGFSHSVYNNTNSAIVQKEKTIILN